MVMAIELSRHWQPNLNPSDSKVMVWQLWLVSDLHSRSIETLALYAAVRA
jgi:hypothetical protein